MSIIKSRIGVFETNSSSCHSLAIKDNIDTVDDAKNNVSLNDVIKLVNELDQNLNLVFDKDELEFGWGPELLNSNKSKIAYAIASKYDIEEIEAAIRKGISNFNHIVLPFIKDMEYKPWWYDKKSGNEDDVYYGYVDHESFGLLRWDLERYNISLEEYFFNSNFGVIIDNDNRDREEPEEELEGWKEV